LFEEIWVMSFEIFFVLFNKVFNDKIILDFDIFIVLNKYKTVKQKLHFTPGVKKTREFILQYNTVFQEENDCQIL
jgi:hypothetical protein